MTDRELIELAGKAAGENYQQFQPEESAIYPDGWGLWHKQGGGFWNPLVDDGDALRLAVKLRLHVRVFADAIGIGTPGSGYVETEWVDDPYAATRRAIVRAAAEIGKGNE